MYQHKSTQVLLIVNTIIVLTEYCAEYFDFEYFKYIFLIIFSYFYPSHILTAGLLLLTWYLSCSKVSEYFQFVPSKEKSVFS